MKVSTIGLDLAKSVFQVHGIDDAGQIVLRRQLRRSEMLTFFGRLPRCLLGMEACASAHYWARQLSALGHEVRLLPASHVKAYVKRGKKNDATDAAAICEAVTRPHMQAVPIKTEEQQAVLMLHRSRDLLIGQRTMLSNALRAHLAEFGIVAALGNAGIKALAAIVRGDVHEPLPQLARKALGLLVAQIADIEAKVRMLDAEILAWHKADAISQRLASIPGIGPITASAMAATVGGDVSRFASGRQLAAWLGLVPRQNSSGGKDRLGAITKTGDRYIRRLLVVGATAMISQARRKKNVASAWLIKLLEAKPARLVSVALANKMARIAWAVLARGTVYQTPAPVMA